MATTPKPTPKHSHDEREDKRDTREDHRDDKRSITREDKEEPQTQPPAGQPAPVETIADEQRKRSEEMASMGVEQWKAEHDERTEEEKAGKQVTGVASPAPESGSWQGSTRTTAPARAAQNPSASR